MTPPLLSAVVEGDLGGFGVVKDNADICGFCVDNPEWLKVNFDTGCGQTGFPLDVGEAEEGSSGKVYKDASGNLVEDEGALTFRGDDEYGRRVNLTGRRAAVHKCLGSAAQNSEKGKMSAYLTKAGGYAIPNASRIGISMRTHLQWLLDTHGEAGLLPIWMENTAHNFYLKDVSGRTRPLGVGQASP